MRKTFVIEIKDETNLLRSVVRAVDSLEALTRTLNDCYSEDFFLPDNTKLKIKIGECYDIDRDEVEE